MAVAAGFAIMARAVGTVTSGGALAGVVVALVLMMAGGLAGFLPLLALFLLTLISTRWGYRRKQRLGVAEHGHGRSTSQVIANLGPAMLCALPLVRFTELGDILLVAATAGLAEAAADTVSSEVGEATARGAYRITDFRDVPIGSNGAISVEGTLAGCVAASIVSWVSASCGLVDWRWTFIVAFAGIAGMFLDSFLGATWESSGKLGNDTVNFISNVFAADIALIAMIILQRLGR